MNRYSRVILCSAAAFMMAAGLTARAQNQSQPAPDTQSGAQAAPEDGHSDFPPGDGRDLTIRVCSTCHSLDTVSTQRLDADEWKNTVDQMAGMGADATEAQLAQITNYLAKAFPPDAK
jgi:cytochrome c5